MAMIIGYNDVLETEARGCRTGGAHTTDNELLRHGQDGTCVRPFQCERSATVAEHRGR